MKKRISKADRLQTYNKYGGRCAYCGELISYKDMQVDHLIPVGTYQDIPESKIWCLDNYMPACRTCNHYKRADSLEAFRRKVERIPEKLRRDSYIAKVGEKYGNVDLKEKKIKFYFEEWEGNIE